MSGAAVAIAVRRARQRIVDHFEAADATRPDRAVAFQPSDRRLDRRTFSQMQRAGAVREVGAGRFYLDRDGLARYRSSLRQRVLGFTALAAGIVAAAVALGG